MDKNRFFLDSNVLIDTLNHKLNLLAFLDNFPDCETYINLVVEIEVLAKSGMSEQEEAEVRALLSSFKWVEINKSVREIAVQIRRAKELRLPDALIAASAITLNATVLSNDPHLLDYQRADYAARPCVMSD
ncbi:MAG: PIN domain-containing protein [Treponema sp.]|jgi:predicted nucleic acid-binding protein|nr:PIN domain-containing protein [Treponema sp.]